MHWEMVLKLTEGGHARRFPKMSKVPVRSLCHNPPSFTRVFLWSVPLFWWFVVLETDWKPKPRWRVRIQKNETRRARRRSL